MPVFDRYWWLRLLGVLLSAVFGTLVFVRLIVPTIAPSRSSADMWSALALGIGLLAAAALPARSAGPARDRMERRERSLAGTGRRARIPLAHVARDTCRQYI
jgi:hypothetical protein